MSRKLFGRIESATPAQDPQGYASTCWADERHLVMHADAATPDRCVRCNAPAHGFRLSRTFKEHFQSGRRRRDHSGGCSAVGNGIPGPVPQAHRAAACLHSPGLGFSHRRACALRRQHPADRTWTGGPRQRPPGGGRRSTDWTDWRDRRNDPGRTRWQRVDRPQDRRQAALADAGGDDVPGCTAEASREWTTATLLKCNPVSTILDP